VPAVAAIRRAFATATLALALPAPFASLGRAIAGVDEIAELEGSGVRHLRGHAAALAAGRFDLGILLTNSFGSALALKRAGVPERWGVRRDLRGLLLTRGVKPEPAGDRSTPEPAPFPPGHHAGYYLDILRALGIDPVPGPYSITVPATSLSDARRRLESSGRRPDTPLVGLAPGAAYGQAKRWPPEHAADAVGMLAAQGVQTVLVGAAADRGTADAIATRFSARGVPAIPPIDLVGQTSLAELMGILAECRLVVSNDSGAMHVAAALGRPVVALFGPTDERRTAPIGPHVIVKEDVWCRPCLLRECPIDHRCLRSIGAGRVVEAVTAWLSPAREAR
jgi:heptosyltransferase-2